MGRGPYCTGVVIAGVPDTLDDAMVDVSPRVAESGHVLAADLLQDVPAGRDFRGQLRVGHRRQGHVPQAVRADLHAGIRHPPDLIRREQRLARPIGIPRVVAAQAAGDHEHGRGEAVARQHRQHVLGEIGVAVVKSEAHQAAPVPPAARLEQAAHRYAGQAPPAQPAHLLLEPRRAHGHPARVLLVRADRVIHQHHGHAAGPQPGVPCLPVLDPAYLAILDRTSHASHRCSQRSPSK
jgi:hypothetical protein